MRTIFTILVRMKISAGNHFYVAAERVLNTEYLTKCRKLFPAIHVKGTAFCLFVWETGAVFGFGTQIIKMVKGLFLLYLQTLLVLRYVAKVCQTLEVF